jgi:hypothetical protein
MAEYQAGAISSVTSLKHCFGSLLVRPCCAITHRPEMRACGHVGKVLTISN